jgi:hypothetical protein
MTRNWVRSEPSTFVVVVDGVRLSDRRQTELIVTARASVQVSRRLDMRQEWMTLRSQVVRLGFDITEEDGRGQRRNGDRGKEIKGKREDGRQAEGAGQGTKGATRPEERGLEAPQEDGIMGERTTSMSDKVIR